MPQGTTTIVWVSIMCCVTIGIHKRYRLSWEQAGEDNNKSDDTDCHGDCEDSCSQQEGNPPETTLNTNLNSNNINCDPDGVSQNGTGE